MKGFMFSLEALAAVAVIILAISVASYSAGLYEPMTNNAEIDGQAHAQTVHYFNYPSDTPNNLTNSQYCIKIEDYNYQAKALVDENSCWWSE